MKWMCILTIVSSIQVEYVLDAFIQAAAKTWAWSYSLIKAGVSEQKSSACITGEANPEHLTVSGNESSILVAGVSPHSSSQVNLVFPGTKDARLWELSANLGLWPFLDSACARPACSGYGSQTDRTAVGNAGRSAVVPFNMCDQTCRAPKENLQQVSEPSYMSLCSTPLGGQPTYPNSCNIWETGRVGCWGFFLSLYILSAEFALISFWDHNKKFEIPHLMIQ